MKLFIISFTLLFNFLISSAYANRCDESVADDFTDTLPKPYLYEVQMAGQSSFLFGTHHFLSPNELPEYVFDALRSSKDLTVENELKTNFSTVFGALKGSFIFSGPKISEQISPEAWTELNLRLSKTKKHSEWLINRLKPMILLTMLKKLKGEENPKAPVDRDLVYDGTMLDQYLVYTVKEALPVYSLEKAGQIAADVINHLVTAQDLEDYLMKPDQDSLSDKRLKEEIERYRRGNEDEEVAALQKTRHERPALYQDLILKRNQKWMPKIISTLQTPGQHFIAVGAAHLFGEDGLIEKLKAAGYKVKRVSEQDAK